MAISIVSYITSDCGNMLKPKHSSAHTKFVHETSGMMQKLISLSEII